jgi:hypothetical protein
VTWRRTFALAGVATMVATGTAALAVRGADGVQSAAIVVDVAHPGRAVPDSFLGFSVEVPAAAAYAGTASHPDLALARLLATLAAAQGSPAALRIGGNSTDESSWAPGAAPGPGPRPRRARYLVGSRWLGRLAWLARVSRAPVTVGVNLAASDPGRALGFARAVRAALPPGALGTVEIGNEPDLYTRSTAFRSGRVVVRRVARRARYDQAATRRTSAATPRSSPPGWGATRPSGRAASPAWRGTRRSVRCSGTSRGESAPSAPTPIRSTGVPGM